MRSPLQHTTASSLGFACIIIPLTFSKKEDPAPSTLEHRLNQFNYETPFNPRRQKYEVYQFLFPFSFSFGLTSLAPTTLSSLTIVLAILYPYDPLQPRQVSTTTNLNYTIS